MKRLTIYKLILLSSFLFIVQVHASAVIQFNSQPAITSKNNMQGGVIGSISDDQIEINTHSYHFNRYTSKLHGVDGKAINDKQLSTGMLVSIALNHDQTKILELWIIKP